MTYDLELCLLNWLIGSVLLSMIQQMIWRKLDWRFLFHTKVAPRIDDSAYVVAKGKKAKVGRQIFTCLAVGAPK